MLTFAGCPTGLLLECFIARTSGARAQFWARGLCERPGVHMDLEGSLSSAGPVTRTMKRRRERERKATRIQIGGGDPWAA